MDVSQTLKEASSELERLGVGWAVSVVDMHTSGEPTRIISKGYPALEGETLLKKRAYACSHLDHIRRRLMREPRGHNAMYGAILVPQTELTEIDEADIGVLFCHNEGYSTMCGHATIALGRFLIDTHDADIFPGRTKLVYNAEGETSTIRLHAPCGIVRITVPTKEKGGKADGSKPVRFVGVPSFVSAMALHVNIRPELQWRQLVEAGKNHVRLDVAYGGAFYAIVPAGELGFKQGLFGKDERNELAAAALGIKESIKNDQGLFLHPENRDLEYLYGVMIVDDEVPGPDGDQPGETGLCFFADQQIDRSPTGSAVCARLALGLQKGKIQIGQRWRYESLVSLERAGNGFTGEVIGVLDKFYNDRVGVIAAVEGRAFYTGTCVFVLEHMDPWTEGIA